MLHRMMPASFQNLVKSDQVRMNIGIRMIDRITHPRLRRQVHYDLRFLLFKQFAKRFPIRNIAPHKIEGSTVLPSTGFLQDPQPLLLEGDIVIIIHLIDAADLSTCFQQPFGQVKSDKARSPCDQICFLWINPVLVHVIFTPASCLALYLPASFALHESAP